MITWIGPVGHFGYSEHLKHIPAKPSGSQTWLPGKFIIEPIITTFHQPSPLLTSIHYTNMAVCQNLVPLLFTSK